MMIIQKWSWSLLEKRKVLILIVPFSDLKQNNMWGLLRGYFESVLSKYVTFINPLLNQILTKYTYLLQISYYILIYIFSKKK